MKLQRILELKEVDSKILFEFYYDEKKQHCGAYLNVYTLGKENKWEPTNASTNIWDYEKDKGPSLESIINEISEISTISLIELSYPRESIKEIIKEEFEKEIDDEYINFLIDDRGIEYEKDDEDSQEQEMVM